MAGKKSVEEKRAYYSTVISRIKAAIKEKGLSQADIEEMSSKKEYALYQSTISKLLQDNPASLNLFHIVELASLLNLDLNKLLALKESESSFFKETNPTISRDLFIRNPNDPRMRPYINTYYIYFLPTKSTDKEMIRGTLRFYVSENGSKCNAELKFKTGKISYANKPVEKIYHGEMIISDTMDACYITLQSDDFAEISYIILHYISVLFEPFLGCLGMALTSSAGASRVPTAHRILLSLYELEPEDIDILKGQLYMNNKEIIISAKGLQKFSEDSRVPKEFIDYFIQKNEDGSVSDFLGIPSTSYFRIDESIIRDAFISASSKLDGLSLLRQYTVSPKYVKIGRADSILHDYLTVKGIYDNSIKQNDG